MNSNTDANENLDRRSTTSKCLEFMHQTESCTTAVKSKGLCKTHIQTFLDQWAYFAKKHLCAGRCTQAWIPC